MWSGWEGVGDRESEGDGEREGDGDHEGDWDIEGDGVRVVNIVGIDWKKEPSWALSAK